MSPCGRHQSCLSASSLKSRRAFRSKNSTTASCPWVGGRGKNSAQSMERSCGSSCRSSDSSPNAPSSLPLLTFIVSVPFYLWKLRQHSDLTTASLLSQILLRAAGTHNGVWPIYLSTLRQRFDLTTALLSLQFIISLHLIMLALPCMTLQSASSWQCNKSFTAASAPFAAAFDNVVLPRLSLESGSSLQSKNSLAIATAPISAAYDDGALNPSSFKFASTFRSNNGFTTGSCFRPTACDRSPDPNIPLASKSARDRPKNCFIIAYCPSAALSLVRVSFPIYFFSLRQFCTLTIASVKFAYSWGKIRPNSKESLLYCLW